MGLVTLKNIRKEEIMKKHTNFLRTILVCALVVCALAAFGISSLAEDAADASTLSIKRSNVAYSAETQLLIELDGTATEGRTAGIAYWDIGEDTTAAPTYNFNPETFQGVTFYRTGGISAQNMSAEFYVCAAERDENGVSYLVGTPKLYGIYSYVKDRLDDEGVSEKQMSLYKNLVLYGNSAELAGVGKDTAEGATVRRPIILLDGGHSIDNGRDIAFADENGNAIIRAGAVNAKGEYFSYWLSEDGTKDYNRVTTVTADNTKNAVYTAVYGSADASAYGGSYNFNNVATGELKVITGNATISSKVVGENTVYFTKEETSQLGGLLILKAYAQVTSDTDKTQIAADTLTINEKNGTKYLTHSKNVIISGETYTNLRFYNKVGTDRNRMELDIRWTGEKWIGTDAYLYFSDGTNAGDAQIYINRTATGEIYITDKRNTGVGDRYVGKFVGDAYVTLAAELTADGVKIYANGKLLTATDSAGNIVETFKFSNANTNVSASYSQGIWMASHAGSNSNVDFLGVNFVDTDKFN